MQSLPRMREVRSISKAIERPRVAWKQEEEKKEPTSKLRVLLEQLKSYCENSSLAGCKYIAENQRTIFERLIWVTLHAIMMFSLGSLVWNSLLDYYHTPVVTVVESDNYPSNLLELPGVSVCTINRISRKSAMKLAKRIELSGVTNFTFDKILDLLHELGSLYETSSAETNFEKKAELSDIMRKYFGEKYDVTDLMKELTPQCNEVLVKCRFRFQARNCSELFAFRKTQDGFCCIFNYVRESDDIKGTSIPNLLSDPYTIKRLDMINGLTFLMEPYLDDYFYSLMLVIGWKVTIFHPTDYPDTTSSGSSRSALISPGTETFLELDAVSFYSSEDVRGFAVKDRRCIFKDEGRALFEGYTYSDCIVGCRLDDIWYTCGCRPFYCPMRFYRRACNTSDVDCLYKFKLKWWSVSPYEMDNNSKEAKTFNLINNESWSLRCKSCYPTCNDVRYILHSSSIKLEKSDRTSFIGELNIVNQSLVNVFFSKYGTVRLKQDIAYYWYELLSNIGGICGVFVGFSLISAVELFYFLILSGLSVWKSNTILENNDQMTNETYDAQSLYWDELAPRAKTNNVTDGIRLKKDVHRRFFSSS